MPVQDQGETGLLAGELARCRGGVEGGPNLEETHLPLSPGEVPLDTPDHAGHEGAPEEALLDRQGIEELHLALSLPGGTVMTLAGGFLFGPVLGTALAVAGATAGACLGSATVSAGTEICRRRDTPLCSVGVMVMFIPGR